MALEHAETIFQTGKELLDRFRQRHRQQKPVLRIGAVDPLSKNLHHDFNEPILAGGKARIVVVAGQLNGFLSRLQDHSLDLVLSNIPLRTDQEGNVYNHLLRLLALSGHSLALVSAIVRERELNSKMLGSIHRVPGLTEKFYAITLRRRFGNPWVEEVVKSFRQRLKAIADMPRAREFRGIR